MTFQSISPYGEKRFLLQRMPEHIHFNPSPLTGRNIDGKHYEGQEEFQSISPYGEKLHRIWNNLLARFQSISPYGEKHYRYVAFWWFVYFNPSPLTGRNHFRSPLCFIAGISIHLPLRGETSYCLFGSVHLYFNPSPLTGRNQIDSKE